MDNTAKPKDNWMNGDLYEGYIGRWSRRVASEFIKWLAVPAGGQWLDVRCGTGALSQIVLQRMYETGENSVILPST